MIRKVYDMLLFYSLRIVTICSSYCGRGVYNIIVLCEKSITYSFSREVCSVLREKVRTRSEYTVRAVVSVEPVGVVGRGPAEIADVERYLAHGASAAQFRGSVSVQRSTVRCEPGHMGQV